MGDASWSVVATADEPLPLLAAFALHHRALGASEIHLYLDKPRSGHAAFLAALDGVRVTACDQAYWHGRYKRSIENRQLHNAFDAYARTGADWLVHIDADEFLSAPADTSIAAVLSDQPGEVDFLVPAMRERVYRADGAQDGLFDGAAIGTFRPAAAIHNPTPALLARARFGAWGLLGHAMGKSFVRTERPIVPGIHRPRPAPDHPRRDARRAALQMQRSARLSIVHFDGLTPFHWVAKLWRMAERMPDAKLARQGKGRRRLIRQVRASLPDAAPIRALERNLRHLDRDSMAALARAGLVHPLPPALAEAVVARGLLSRPDFSRDAFDREMVAMYPQLELVFARWQELDARAAQKERPG